MISMFDADAMQEKAFQMNFHGRISERELFLFNRALSELPTLDVAPVVHGEWELGIDADGDPVIYCTNCMMPTDVKTNCCPTCGAIMDGKEQDDG